MNVGIYHYMSPQHLHRYYNEFATRYNQRDVTNIARFQFVIRNSQTKKITYDKQTRKKVDKFYLFLISLLSLQ